MMKKVTTIVAIVMEVLILVGVLGIILAYFEHNPFDSMVEWAAIIGTYGGVVLLVRDGTLVKNIKIYKLLLFSFGITFLGSILKIMHWPFASSFLLVGLISIPMVYCMHFLMKKEKQSLDYLKLLWVVLASISSVLIVFHYPFARQLKLVETMLFVIMFSNYTFLKIRTDW